MKISELLKKDTMILNLASTSKEAVIDELVSKLSDTGRLADKASFKKAILAREAQSTTGVGEGIAIPHAKTAAVKTPAIAFGRSDSGVDYDSLDGKHSHLFFMIAASEGANNDHLETLSRLSRMLMDGEFRKKLMEADSLDTILSAIDQKEAVITAEDEEEKRNERKSGKVLAVTGCPTGIAHTYMAADNLKSTAKELGVEIKVETNGSSGVQNRLTDQEINDATAIIIAADTAVEMDRFRGKHVVQAGVTDGIRRPKELIEQAIAQDAPVYQGDGESFESKVEAGKQAKKGKQNAFYKHLMNGVSYMLPFVVGGGILIALSFMFGINAADPNSPDYNKFADALMTIGGGNAFGLMIPILAGFIAMSIADRPGLAPGMVGGFMAAQGGAGFLGGLIAGFLAGYIVVALKRLLEGMPQSLAGIKTILLYPLLGIFATGMLMFFVINEPVGIFNEALQDWLSGMGTTNAVLLGILLGGMMAVDMGGPINKAAFTFGIAMIDAGNFSYHAAVMAGGMVPPLGLAIATTIFKNKFTKEERDAGKSCYIMGASFITEGAIPFAAADPGRVIPSIIIGSSVAGALTMLFDIGLRAPHGGIFVIPFVEGSAILYTVAVLAGSIVTALIVGFWKKPA